MAKYDLLRKAIFEEQKEKSERNNESPISRHALAEREEKAREREAEKRAAVEKAIADVGIVPAAPRYERQYNMPEIAADNVAPYLREVTLAQKEYDDYVNSQEFQQRKQEAAAKLTQNTPMSEVPRNAPQIVETFEDETSKGLKAKADYWKNQQDNARTSQIDAENLRKISLMPEEDQKALATYAQFFIDGDRDRIPLEDLKAAESARERYGTETFKRLAETYSRQQNTARAEQAAQDARANVDTGPKAVLQNVLSVPGKLIGGIYAATGRLSEPITRTGQYPTLAPVLSSDLTSIYYDAVREETGNKIVGEGDKAWRNALGYGYQATMSTADSLLRLAVLGPQASLGAVAMDSFASGVREATQNGANPAQAYAMATVNAGLEVLTEKIPMDTLLAKAKAGATKDLTKFLLNAFGQAGVEISTEEASLIGSTLAEAAILQEKSEYNQTIQQLVVDGYSYADAKAAAAKAIVDEAKTTAIVSGLSGEISSLTATVYSNAVARAEAKTNASQNAQEAVENPQTRILPETSMDTTKAQSPDTEAAGAPQAGNALTNALDKLAETGNVSNKTVEKILADPAAMEQLSRQTGLDLSQMATASEKRNAVKAAVRQMAGDTAPTTLNREGAQSLIEDMGRELAERAPARQETPEVTPERQAVQNAFDRVLGVDTGTDGNYNAINGNPIQGGTENETGNGGVQRNTENNPSGEIAGGGEDGKGNVQSGDQGGVPGGVREGTLHTSDSEGRKLTLEQAERLQNSAVVDDKGSPIAVYHSTDNMEFDTFAKGDVGFHFGTVEQAEKRSADKGSTRGRTFRAYLDIKNPFRADLDIMGWKADGASLYLWSRGVLTDAESQEIQSLSANGTDYDSPASVRLREMLEGKGYDGISYPNGFEGAGDSYIAFRDDQIIRSEVTNFDSPQVADSSGKSTEGGQSSTLGAQNAPSGDINQSKTFTNSGLNSADPDIRAAYEQTMGDNPKAADYEVKHNADTRATAQERTSTPERVQAEYNYLLGKTDWTAEDNTTAHRIISELQKNGGDGAQSQITEMQMKIREVNANAGQLIQSNRIGMTMEDASTPAAAAQRAVNTIMDMDEKNSTFRQKKGGQTYKQWQKATADNLNRIGMEIERVKDGDSAGMRDIIRQIARSRKTTAWFGTSQNLTKAAETVLGTLDFDDLKVVASTQLAAMPDDFRARTKTEVAMAVRKSHMLASLKTTIRNLSGNASAGFLDAMSDSGAGQLMDSMLSKITGKRVVGNDLTKVGAYAKGATNAAKFAALCVELDIPVETDSLSSFSSAVGGKSGGKYMGKTFRPDGNVAMRAMYAFQKYMGYDLDVSDKIFEGGTNKAVSESLTNIKNSGLTDKEVQRLSEYTANRRTFKDATWIDENGKRHGSTLSRGAVGIKNAVSSIGAPAEIAADVVLPFASVPANVAQTGIDYTVGIAKGTGEIISIIKDAKAGKNIDVVRQRQAVSDFGRGVTGTVMIAAFAAAAARGIIKVNSPKDKDEKALIQAEGRNGAQFNWSAFQRSLSGESDGWQDGDIITSFDFLEPFNTQLYLGYELAQGDSVLEALAKYPDASVQSVLNSFMDTPMMSGLVDITELVDNLTSAETAGERADAFAGYAGDTASSFIPQYLRQAAQVADGYYRDTRGDTSAEYAMNNILAAIPGLSQTLPKKYSGLGEAQERGGFVSTFIDPTNTQVYRQNSVTGYLEDLSQSLGGDTSFIPDRQAPMKLRVNGEDVELDGTARETYQKTYGELVNGYYSRLMNSSVFQNLPDEQKANALKRAESYATEHARAAVSDFTTDKPRDAAEVTNGIIKDLMRSEFSKAFDTMEADKLDQAYGLYKSLPVTDQADFRKETGGRVGYYITAKEKGVSDGVFTDLYGTYKELGDNSGMTNSQRAQEWARTLGNAYESGRITKTAHDALKEEMKFRQTFSINTEKFDAMTESGLTSDTADQIIKGLADLQGTGSVNKDTGEATVTNRDKWGYIAALDGLSDKEKDRLMLLYMPDYDPEAEKPNKTELKYAYLRGRGYSAEQFTQTYGVTQEFTRKADMIAAWVALGYSSEEAQMFYKLYKGKLV